MECNCEIISSFTNYSQCDFWFGSEDNTCNDDSLTEVDLSRFQNMRKIEIGSNSLQHAQQLTMNGLNKLTSFEIGEGSFNQSKTVNIGSNSLNAMAELNLQTFQSLNEVSIGEGSMNAAESVNASGLTNLNRFVVNGNSLEETTEYVNNNNNHYY